MTQEYASRKIVTAWRDDRHGDIPEGAPEGYKGEVIEGYAVKYNDGYTSWCPKLKFEEDTLPLGNIAHLPAFQQRLLAERADLAQRTEGLGKYVATLTGNSSPVSEKHNALLIKQHSQMVELLATLDERIEDLSDASALTAQITLDPALEDLSKGFVEQLSDVTAAEALKATVADGAILTVRPIKNETFNAYAESDPHGDSTDSLNSVLVTKVFDSIGNELPMSYKKVDSSVVWMQRFFVTGPEFDFYVEANLQRGQVDVAVNQCAEGLKAQFAFERVNLNRRPG